MRMFIVLPILFSALTVASGCDKVKERFSGPKTSFDAQAAMGYAKAQVDFGARVPGTPAHVKAGDWIIAQMKTRADTVIVQSWTQTTTKGGQRVPMRNIFAQINRGCDAAGVVSHALGHAPGGGRRPELRRQDAAVSRRPTTARRASGC